MTIRRRITPEDLWAFRRVGVPAPAPDGSFAVVGVTSYDVAENKGRERLWRLSAGGEATPLTSPDVPASQPVVSPDGRRLAFVRTPPGKDRAQLFVMPLAEGGEPRQLGDFPLGVTDPRWFPDGRRLAVLAPLYRAALTLDGTRRLAEERAKAPPPHVTEDRLYRFWDRWLTDGQVHHLFVVDVETGEARDLVPDSERWFDLMEPGGQYDISPDGDELAFSANVTTPPYERVRMGIFLVPAAGGPARCLTPDHPADAVRPRYSPDGKFLVYGMKRQIDNHADRVRVARVDRATGLHVTLTEAWDRSASAWEYLDRRTIVVQADDRARVALFTMPIDGGPVTPAPLIRDGSVTLARVPAGGWIWLQHHSSRRPPEVARVRAEGGPLQHVGRFNDALLAELELGTTEDLEIAGAGGDPVHVLVVYPPGFDRGRRWPLVHFIHGGPYGAFGDGWHFRWQPHVVAAQGWVVACVNFHGSSGFGQAFSDAIMGDWGGKAAEDILLATDHLVAAGFVDPERMAITGGSFGGYMTAWLATQTRRFRCGVAHAAVFDVDGMMGGDFTQGIDHELGGAAPWGPPEERARIDRFSPERHAHAIETPLLVIHGEKDYRVPAAQGLALYGILKAKGVPARLVYYPDENHWILKPKNSLHWYGEFLGWLRRWLG